MRPRICYYIWACYYYIAISQRAHIVFDAVLPFRHRAHKFVSSVCVRSLPTILRHTHTAHTHDGNFYCFIDIFININIYDIYYVCVVSRRRLCTPSNVSRTRSAMPIFFYITTKAITSRLSRYRPPHYKIYCWKQQQHPLSYIGAYNIYK